MAILLKIASVRVSSIQIMQVRVQNKGKSVWKSRYDGDVSRVNLSQPTQTDAVFSRIAMVLSLCRNKSSRNDLKLHGDYFWK